MRSYLGCPSNSSEHRIFLREKNSPSVAAAADADADADDVLEFLDGAQTPEAAAVSSTRPWRILIVDDDADVHRATELAMQGLMIEGEGLHFLHAYSAMEARLMLVSETNLAVALVDVVMESEDAGLKLVRYIRDDLGIGSLRIVPRTGQPGYAPKIETVQTYDINDYRPSPI